MGTSLELARGREAVHDRSWQRAYDLLAGADARGGLSAEDLELLATSAFLSGHDRESTRAWGRAHRAWLERGEPVRASRTASVLALRLLLGGDQAMANGWLARAERLLRDAPSDCAEHGRFLVPTGLQALAAGDPTSAREAFAGAVDLGIRCGDRDGTVIARIGLGQCLVATGRVTEGIAMLDDAMVDVMTGEVSPEDDGAVGNRDARYALGIKAMWPPGSPGGQLRRWVRDSWEATRRFSTGGNYVNFQTADEDEERVRSTYGSNYARLAELKQAYDPDNLFRANRNVRPAGASRGAAPPRGPSRLRADAAP